MLRLCPITVINALSIFLLIYSATGSSVFNSEIGLRVEDYITGYTDLIYRAVLQPYEIIVSKNMAINLTNPYDAQKFMYPVKLTYPEVTNIFIGFENKLWYGYIWAIPFFTHQLM